MSTDLTIDADASDNVHADAWSQPGGHSSPQARNRIEPGKRPTSFSGSHGERSPVESQAVSTVNAACAEADAWPKAEQVDPHSRSGRLQAKAQSQSWLERDPFQWVGRSVRNRRTGTVYVVRDVYASGRVDLERRWMIYSSHVRIIRTDFETYS